MCGIVGYIGPGACREILLAGLARLEYRGYDSAGVALLNGDLKVAKCAGRVRDLEARSIDLPATAAAGIGHTRWATHGGPSDANAHPHVGPAGRIALVHNGIIENYTAIKTSLTAKGRTFRSQTDSEVLVQLIEEIQASDGALSFEAALRLALRQVTGTYGLAILNAAEPDRLYVARCGSPLVVGVGDGEMFVASDAAPIVAHTNKVVYLDDGDVAVISRDRFEVRSIDDVPLTKEVHELAMSLDAIEKAGFPHFMLKEIHEQPRAIADCLRGRLVLPDHVIQLGGLSAVMERLSAAPRLTIAACGTSWHSGLVGEYLFEHLARLPVEVEYASEFRYREPLLDEHDVLLAISQSGETADTIAALREAKRRGALTLGICNVVGSTLSRETDAGVFTHAGPEIGVASTKAFTAQVVVLTLMAIALGRQRGTLPPERADALIEELARIPQKIASILEQEPAIKSLADRFTYAPNFLYLGRSFNFPVALEGALKLKEISYIHAEGYPAAEMKHGPIALIDRLMPVVVLATTSHTSEKMISNIEEVRARNGRVIAITTPGQDEVKRLAEFVVEIPATDDALAPLLAVIPLQLLAYHIAVNRGCDVDQPRNLAKSVTVE
ncbi:MAG: glutamine--fructose-6-phosphate transaminase (isomerizing) [Planctomycetota bacterium]|nr:MAG: glutamine--fructose-6-phosphate transaminase (isomerizing) [Planctomycetota bacterium]